MLIVNCKYNNETKESEDNEIINKFTNLKIDGLSK